MARLEAWAAAMVRRWARTLRVTYALWDGRRIGQDDPWIAGRLFAVTERDLLALFPLADRREWVTAIAPGPDGDRAASLVRHLNAHVARGAAGRSGHSAMESLVRLSTADRPVLLSVDGPLGPAGVAKPGVVSLGALCDREVVPLAAAARWSFRFPRTWSGIYLPLPFSRVWVQAGEPLEVSGATGRQERAQAAAVITARLHEARSRALAGVRGV